MKGLLFLAIFFLLCSCSSYSLDDFYEEGQGIALTLVEELRQINTRDQLLSKTPKLKKMFDSLVDVMIKAHDFRRVHADALANQSAKREHLLTDQLRSELSRLYGIEGARDIIENCQEEALNRLDAAMKRN